MSATVGSSGAVGIGIATRSLIGTNQPVLDVRFVGYRLGGWGEGAHGWDAPGCAVVASDRRAEAAAVAGQPGLDLAALSQPDPDRRVRREVIAVGVADLGRPPEGAADVYLRLHLLSARLVRPHSINLDGMFGQVHNVVWTNCGPCDSEDFDTTRWQLLAAGRSVHVWGVDRFPRMVDYVIPSGVRIADADRVRLGAHLAEGTVVMHEGFCNFNAGTLGTSMVEGRISAGVVVGANSDIGGSASIMGTLSGGGKEVISIGERCLLGANSGIGISLGDDCVVEAGLYVTAGTLVTLPDGAVAKGVALSGANGLLFRRNGRTGTIEVVPRSGREWGGLNAALHAPA